MLGLRTVRTVEELTAAYRPLILQWHPDRHHGQATHAIAVERATAINDAYAFLLAAWIFINVHHYFLDSVVWRKGNPETGRYLFR